MSTFDFANSGCAWCHPGGGSLEYDRDGYRYDNKDGGFFQEGNESNPLPAPGDYYTFADGLLVNKTEAWQAGGVAEVDCLMCHLGESAAGFRYSNLERNYAPPAQKLGLAASLGLAGRAGVQGLLNISSKGTATQNPDIAQTGWSWADIGAGTARVPGAMIRKTPGNDNCSLCHFPDKGHADVPALQKGPANKPLDFTVFQKLMTAGSTDDGDEIAWENGKDGRNDEVWMVAKEKAEGAKLGESINDPLNPDVHMDADKGNMSCVSCHYALSGDFNALVSTGSNTTVIQPGLTVTKIDHQFAKGDNAPDGGNMDRLANTVTCSSCHIDRTHPNAGAAPAPAEGHAGIPAFHFNRINCKTCHIPYLNGPVVRLLSDFTAGPYRTFERAQVIEPPAAGIGRRPLYMQRMTEPGNGRLEIQPFGIVGAAFWAGCLSEENGECVSFVSIFQRLAEDAAEALRMLYGDADNDGVYDWPLNRPQGGDTTLIINTRDEIGNMVSRLISAGGKASLRPVLQFYFNQFTVSHNVRPKKFAENRILGSAAGGGCVMCHSSSDKSSPFYSSKSAGFFDKRFTLFNQPVDGGTGLVQTAMSDGTGKLKRVNIKFPYVKSDGSKSFLDLSGEDGETVGNEINQGDVLGFDPGYLEKLLDPRTAGIAKPTAAAVWSNDAAVSGQVNFSALTSSCSGACTYTWDFGDNSTGSGISTSHVYTSAGDYPAALTVEDTQYGFTATVAVTVRAKSLNAAPADRKQQVSSDGSGGGISTQ